MERKKLCVFFSFLLFSFSLQAINLDFKWDFGNVFIDTNVKFKNKVETVFDAGVKLGYIGVMDKNNSLEVGYCPFIWNSENSFGAKIEESINSFDFLNLEVFYDLFSYNNNFSLGPYLDINYLDLINLDFSSYKTDIGFKFSYFIDKEGYEYLKNEIATLKSGFRLKNNTPCFFVEAGVNVLSLTTVIIKSYYEEVKEVHNRL